MTDQPNPFNVAGMPEFDALLDHIYEYGTASEGIIDRANAFARALLARYGAQPAASAEPLTETYVQTVPDKCDRIVWRGSYYHLPLQAVAQEPVACFKCGHAKHGGECVNAAPQPAAPVAAQASGHPAEGEEIMVNTPYDVFTLPLKPSGLSSGPRFVVHVPGPEQQPGVCPECKGSCRTGSGYLREDCPACNGTGQQPAQPEALVEAVARAICVACEENPDHEGDARGNDFRWQDYRDAALAAISALAAQQQEARNG